LKPGDIFVRVLHKSIGVLQCVAGCCRMLQCVAVCCSVLQCVLQCTKVDESDFFVRTCTILLRMCTQRICIHIYIYTIYIYRYRYKFINIYARVGVYLCNSIEYARKRISSDIHTHVCIWCCMCVCVCVCPCVCVCVCVYMCMCV